MPFLGNLLDSCLANVRGLIVVSTKRDHVAVGMPDLDCGFSDWRGVHAYVSCRTTRLFAVASGGIAPELGQHTDEILRAFGYAPSELERLRKEAII